MRIAAAALLVALALSGCAGDDSEPTQQTVTCPDGQVLQVNGTATPDPAVHCPKPKTPPAVRLLQHDAAPSLYRPVEFTWSVSAGDFAQGHSMLTSLRLSPTPVAASALSGPDSYGTEAAKHEHQNLPVELAATHTFTEPGTYYLRVYATILHEADPDGADYWSDEVAITVADVAPTGNTTTVTHPVGNVAGALSPASVDLVVGDALVFQNDDLTAHTLTQDSGPEEIAPIMAEGRSASTPVVFKAPGTHTFRTDDVQPQTLTVNVRA